MKKLYLILAFFIIFLGFNVSAETIINETMTSNNATLWSVASGAFNANYLTTNYGYKVTGANTPTTIFTDLQSVNIPGITYGKIQQLNMSIMVNETPILGHDHDRVYVFGIGVAGSTTPYWAFQINDNALSGGTVYLQFHNGADTIMLDTTLAKDSQYNLSLRIIANQFSIYNNGALLYSNNTLVTISSDADFYITKQRTTGTGTGNSNGNFFIGNITFTQADAGYLVNFTVRDEMSYGVINYATMKFFLYDTDWNQLDSKLSTTGMTTFTNLSAGVTYYMVYHDSVYNSRTYVFTPNVYYDNITLFITNTSVSIPIDFKVIDNTNSKFIEGAQLKIYKTINSTSILIYNGITDSSGTATVYINTTDIYTINTYKSGYKNFSGIIQNPSTSIYYVNLENTISGSSTETNQNFYYRISPSNNYLLYPTSGIQPINFYVAGIGTNIEYITINSTVNGTSYSNISINPFGDTINISVYVSNFTSVHNTNKSFEVKFYVKTSDLIIPWNTTFWYYVSDSENLTNRTMITGLVIIKDEFSIQERIVLSMAVTIALVFLLSYVLPGSYAMVVGLLVLGTFALADFFPMIIFIFISAIGLVIFLSGGDK